MGRTEEGREGTKEGEGKRWGKRAWTRKVQTPTFHSTHQTTDLPTSHPEAAAQALASHSRAESQKENILSDRGKQGIQSLAKPSNLEESASAWESTGAPEPFPTPPSCAEN